MRKIEFGNLARIIAAFCVAIAVASPAQTFTTLFRFDGTHGEDSLGSLVQGTDGNFYGTTGYGGTSSKYCPFSEGCGTVFKMTPGGQVTVIYSFCRKANCADGSLPNGALLQGTNGSFYGAAAFGGVSPYCTAASGSGGCGTIFEITPTGKLKTLYNFCAQKNCTDGALPNGSLILGANGNFYGTGEIGGKNCVYETYDSNGCGTVFEITPAGKLTTLYSFCAQIGSNGSCADGNNPVSGLLLTTNGNFYGTTYDGGVGYCGGACGTVFELTPAGKLSRLHSFCEKAGCADGQYPNGGLVQATNGKFYGTASNGGTFNNGGTVFEITAAGKLTTLYRFCAQPTCKWGGGPVAGLVQGTDGNLYGAATYGGTSMNCPAILPGCGTIFKITLAGKLTKLYNFCPRSNCADGVFPEETLLQGTDGSFYGTTHQGGLGTCGNGGCGTIFRLSVGLGPFVQANPNFGNAGRVVDILGNKLTGTTKVTFNGTPATFTVASSTEIKTTVPTGATTGKIKVTTPERILVSNVAFRVLK
jgi:uncharacterized repeat protein (TIGR03803 family)